MCHKSTFNLRMPSNLHGVIVQENGNLDSFSSVKIHQLMLYREIIAVCSQFQTKNTNTLCGQNVKFVNVKPGGVSRDNSVSIATGYRLDCLGFESQRGVSFSSPFQTGPGAHPASYTVGTVSFPGVKWPGRGVDHPPPSSAKVKEGVELYIYSPSGPSRPVIG
jgi:hypothetical protein